MFCDNLVNKDREISNRTGCFNISKRADTATKLLFEIGIRMCKSDAECDGFNCLDATNETYGFCGTREFCQINVEAPAKKPLVPCSEDMDCVHLMDGMVGSAGLIPNVYCNKTGDFCCSGLLDVCFGGNLVRPLRPYEEPVVCPDGIHPLFIEPVGVILHAQSARERYFPGFFGFSEIRTCRINSECEPDEVCIYYLGEGQCAAFPNPNFLEDENDEEEEEEEGWAERAVDLYRQTAYGIAIVWDAYEEMMMRRMEERHEEILENWRREKYGTRHTKQTCECVTSTETPSSLYSSELSEAEKRKKWTKTFRRGRGRRVMKQKKRMHQRRRNKKRARMEKSNEEHMRRSTRVFLKAFVYGAPLFLIMVIGFFFVPNVVSNAITAEIYELMKEVKEIGQDAISGVSNDKNELLKLLVNGKVTIADYVSHEEAMVIIPTLVMTALFLLGIVYYLTRPFT
ncbi:unnamed protein product [Caenorhabditis bovis]|nr:unnamed protein product [Caenorhabditis bovis]